MLVSVLMPVYNVEKFIEEALLSICNQTYKDLEIVVIDDCSTDNTKYIVRNIMKKDNRIRFYCNSRNIGLVSTLNKGLKYISGEYVVRMDGDDISLPNRIEKMLAYLNTYPNCVLVGSQVIRVDDNGTVIGYSNFPNSLKQIKKVCPYISPILHIWMCKTSLYKDLKGYRNIVGAEDYDFILRIISSGYQIANLPDYLHKVRYRLGNTVGSIGRLQQMNHEYCVKLYRERLRNNSEIDSYNFNYLLSDFVNEKENDKFLRAHEIFMKGYFLIKNKNYIGIIYIAESFLLSKDVRNYIINRIIFRLIMMF